MASISYSLSTKHNQNNEQEILIRFTHGRINQRAKTNIFIPTEYWDIENKKITIPNFRIMSQDRKDLKEYLTMQSGRLNTLTFLIQKSFHEIDKNNLAQDWLRVLVKQYNFPNKYTIGEKEKTSQSFFEIFEEFLLKRKLSEVRIKRYKVLHRALQRYELFVSMTEDNNFKLTLNGISTELIESFDSFLRNEHLLYEEYKSIYNLFPIEVGGSRKIRIPKPRGTNTINTLFKAFRAFLNWCIDNEKMTNKPFKNYESKPDLYGTPYYITIEERNQLYKTNLSRHPQLAIQRDIFVFQCLIGCRVSDLYKMTSLNIIDGAIEYIPAKTKEGRPITVRVPLNEIAKDILGRYKDCNDKLLPFISEQKYNVAIKKMFIASGLTRPVTIINSLTRESEVRPLNEIASSHLARRSFVGNLYKQVKDPNLVGALSGHKEGSKAFARYRDIDEDMKKDLVKLLE